MRSPSMQIFSPLNRSERYMVAEVVLTKSGLLSHFGKWKTTAHERVIAEIAWTLCGVPRFMGQSLEWWSVGQHVLLMLSHLIWKNPSLDGHDVLSVLEMKAHQAYMGHLPKAVLSLYGPSKAEAFEHIVSSALHESGVCVCDKSASLAQELSRRALFNEYNSVIRYRVYEWDCLRGVRPLEVPNEMFDFLLSLSRAEAAWLYFFVWQKMREWLNMSVKEQPKGAELSKWLLEKSIPVMAEEFIGIEYDVKRDLLGCFGEYMLADEPEKMIYFPTNEK